MERKIITVNQYKLWLVGDTLHREDGPAIEWVSGTKEWFVNGRRHRIGFPAIESFNGHKEWWVGGVELDKHPLATWLNDRNLYNAFKEGTLTKEQIIEINLIFEF